MIFWGGGADAAFKKFKKKYPLISILVIGARGGPCFKEKARERTSGSGHGVALALTRKQGNGPRVHEEWSVSGGGTGVGRWMKCPRPSPGQG